MHRPANIVALKLVVTLACLRAMRPLSRVEARALAGTIARVDRGEPADKLAAWLDRTLTRLKPRTKGRSDGNAHRNRR